MKIIVTGDGTHTLFVPELHEHYHSIFGALTESMHVFIEAGLRYHAAKKQITVFEIGFGTGLNALLSCIEALDAGTDLLYYTIENNPVDLEIIQKLNYSSVLKSNPCTPELFRLIHSSEWGKTINIHERFRLHKIRADIAQFIPDFSYDLIFFDAFAPEKQPELWTVEIFKKLYNAINEGGILTTYCVKGDVKRALKMAGFLIEKLPGPPGKREMLRGRKKGVGSRE